MPDGGPAARLNLRLATPAARPRPASAAGSEAAAARSVRALDEATLRELGLELDGERALAGLARAGNAPTLELSAEPVAGDPPRDAGRPNRPGPIRFLLAP